MFCAYPRISLSLEAPPDSVEDQSADLSRIASNATIREVDVVLAIEDATWHCKRR